MFLLFVELKRQILSKRYKHIPGVAEAPFIGSWYVLKANLLQGKLTFLTEGLHLFRVISPDFNVICGIVSKSKINKLFLGPKLIFFISDPDASRSILSGNVCTDRPEPVQMLRYKYGILAAKCKLYFRDQFCEIIFLKLDLRFYLETFEESIQSSFQPFSSGILHVNF